MIYVKVPNFFSYFAQKFASNWREAHHKVDSTFDVILKVKYFQVFKDRGALRACNFARDCAREEMISREKIKNSWRFQLKKHLQSPKAPIIPEWKFDLTSDIHDRLSLESSRADLCGQGLRKHKNMSS